jgi:hypothetical protein
MTAKQCTTYAWCTEREDDVEHRNHHGGAIVELTGSDGSGQVGWWCWLSQDRDPDGEVMVQFEGNETRSAPTVSFEAAAETVAGVLAAAAGPESREALLELLRAAGVAVPS